LAGWIEFAEAQRKQELAERAQVYAMAARGDPKKLEQFIKDLTKA
jgi:hypothetical protein